MKRPHRPALAVLLAALLLAPFSLAQTPAAPAAAPGSWASQLDELTRWVEAHRGPAPCAERCFALTRLRLTGALEPGSLQFELEGAVLAPGPVPVPLFGPPGRVRLENVTEDGRPAAVSFDASAYFVQTASRRFVLRGSLTLVDELALTIPGPVNALDADITGARVVEGAHLAGLSNVTIHLDRGSAAAPAAGPTVFQRSHALRVGREVSFTDRLVLQSGNDLGVVRLPLRNGERVLDVTGSTGWRVDGDALLLPTAGRSAEITITGSLASVGSFEPDPRSEYEWWLLESDPEHRLTVTGDARQIDAAESPIPRTQPGSRLYLVERGHHLAVSVQTLSSLDALAAVVHSHRRTTVLTRRGDLVSDDTITYENNGIDYLTLDPGGRPIFLATDGVAERIMHADRDAREVLVSLRNGRHDVRAQSLGSAPLGLFGGAIELPTPRYRLTASRVTADVGLPAFVAPLAVLGGDRPWFALGVDDLFAALVAFGLAWLIERDARHRALLGAVVAGSWFVSGALYAAALSAAVLWILRGLLLRRTRTVVRTLLLGALGFGALLVVGGIATFSRGRSERAPVPVTYDEEGGTGGRHRARGPLAEVASSADDQRRDDNNSLQRLGRSISNGYQAVTDGSALVQGVTPVAITLPAYERMVSVSRELVTAERPFRPRIYYLTSWTTGLLGLAWAALALLLAFAHRAALARLAVTLRDRLRPEEERATPGDAP